MEPFFTTVSSRSLLHKFPSFIKPFYEIPLHKKVVKCEYDLLVAIPVGKRAYIWFTRIESRKVVCIIELGRNQQLIDHVHFLNKWEFPDSYCLGTILSGYWIEGDETCPGRRYFVADDIYCFEGIELGNPCPKPFQMKYNMFRDFFKKMDPYGLVQQNCSIHSIIMWKFNEVVDISDVQKTSLGYDLKHLQLRSSSTIVPHCNHIVSKNPWLNGTGPSIVEDELPKSNSHIIWNDITSSKYKKVIPQWNFGYGNPIFKNSIYVWVTADIAYDVYYLQVQNDIVLDNALICNIHSSKCLNAIFRQIPENDCLDIIEESDDETDFTDMREDKYVDLQKKALMRCTFHRKFKKWMPIELVNSNDLTKSSLVPTIQSFLYSPKSKSNGNLYSKGNASSQRNLQYTKYAPTNFHERRQKEKIQSSKKNQFKKRKAN